MGSGVQMRIPFLVSASLLAAFVIFPSAGALQETLENPGPFCPADAGFEGPRTNLDEMPWGTLPWKDEATGQTKQFVPILPVDASKPLGMWLGKITWQELCAALDHVGDCTDHPEACADP